MRFQCIHVHVGNILHGRNLVHVCVYSLVCLQHSFLLYPYICTGIDDYKCRIDDVVVNKLTEAYSDDPVLVCKKI